MRKHYKRLKTTLRFTVHVKGVNLKYCFLCVTNVSSGLQAAVIHPM